MTSSRCSPFSNNHQHFANCTAATANRSFDVIRCFEHIMVNYSVLSTSVCSENQRQPKCAKSSFTLARYVDLCYISCVCTYVLSLSLSSILYSICFYLFSIPSYFSIILPFYILYFPSLYSLFLQFLPQRVLSQRVLSECSPFQQDFRSMFDGEPIALLVGLAA